MEAIGPFPEIARQVVGADAMMGADEQASDLAEQGMDDREIGKKALAAWSRITGVCFKC
jgi:hypothetical protein